ncbi:hypothetical protein CD798_11400 [Bacillaceae bacterium SAOS 7]|nr:hypothetical protein CD798_11400 [Bacillaceae bacterium SAOS 7]
MHTQHILFLSPVNHLSIMAEGWASKLHAPMSTFISASYFHASEDHLPIVAMQEVNIDISHLQAKPLTPELLKEADLVIAIYDFNRDEQLDIPSFDQKTFFNGTSLILHMFKNLLKNGLLIKLFVIHWLAM